MPEHGITCPHPQPTKKNNSNNNKKPTLNSKRMQHVIEVYYLSSSSIAVWYQPEVFPWMHVAKSLQTLEVPEGAERYLVCPLDQYSTAWRHRYLSHLFRIWLCHWMCALIMVVNSGRRDWQCLITSLVRMQPVLWKHYTCAWARIYIYIYIYTVSYTHLTLPTRRTV